jgi:hypothetical protein
MPREAPGRWSGRKLHGAGGEYVYEHPDGTACSVHPEPESGGGWAVTVDPTGSKHGGRADAAPTTLATGMGHDEAFEYARGWMRGYDSGGMTQGHGGGNGGWLPGSAEGGWL